MIVREEGPEDQDDVRETHRQGFGDHASVVVPLVDDLRDSPGILSLVAEADGAVIGHVMVSRGLLDAPRRLVEVRTLSPIAVRPEHQGGGVGRALIARALEILADQGVPLVFLEGSPAYYARSGFSPAGELGFRKPSLRIPDAAFQVIRLPAYEPWMTGTYVYADVFWRHDAVGLRP
jgi:putative acetyltransferase